MSQDKLLAVALERLEALRRKEAFDPAHLDSRPTAKQQEFFDDFGQYKQYYLRAGNQCLAKGTLVATPSGPVAIENIQVGDTVYSEHGTPIKVLKTFQNGIKEVADLTCRGVRWASSTPNHVFQVSTPYANKEEKKVSEFGRDDRVCRISTKAPLGTVSFPQAYALAALLGDGCSRQHGSRIQLSSGTAEVPYKAAQVCGSAAIKLHEQNHTWSIGIVDIPHYAEWCKGRYAHEKIVDLSILKTWNRQSLLEFVAGLIDTDGTVYATRDQVTLSLNMQAKSVVDAFEYAILALWQVPLSRALDARSKYKNGPVHVAYTRNVNFVREIMEELDPYIVSPQKKWKEEYNTIGGKRSSSKYIGLKYGFNTRLEETYDIHVDSDTNLYLLANGLVTHNSGKSQTAARILTQILLEEHPLVAKKRADSTQKGWGNEPLLAIVAGRTGKQLEDSLLPKIRSYLEPGTYKEVRMGNAIQRLELDNGNRIVFQSLENPNTARERLQSYVAHITWVDELPPTLDLIREVLVRTQARDGFSVFSFTPLTVNVDIQRFVDAIEPPEGKVYRFRMLDNPLYSDPTRREELVRRYAHLPEYQRNAIFEGDWMTAEDQVYHFDYETMVGMPEGYSPMWRHIEAVDPAISSATGLTIWAEDPNTSIWYCVVAEYIRNIQVPTDIVKAVQHFTSKVNVVRRISDYAPWYVNTASSMGITYMTVDSKNSNRKDELIKNLQEALGNRMIITPVAVDLVDEIQNCRWSSRGEGKIINSSTYHLLDSAQYARDVLPPPEKKLQSFTVDQWYAKLLHANEKRKQLEDKALAKPRGRPTRIKRGIMWR